MGRQGEENKSYFRSERTVFVNDRWYFLSRETGPEGPYNTRDDAREAAERYAMVMQSRLFNSDEAARINKLKV
jgi:hypothetical protein